MYTGLDNRINVFRPETRGNYATDLSNLQDGCLFPDDETKARNRCYRFHHKLFTGEYGQDKMLTALINDTYQEINYSCLSLNYFELIANKLDSLLFGNEVTVKTGDITRDGAVSDLIEKTAWVKSIREAVKMCIIYGDSYIKTFKFGASAFPPMFAYRVVDPSNKKHTKYYVCHELLYERSGSLNNICYTPKYIHFIISGCGFDFERVHRYDGSNTAGRIGEAVKYKFRNRRIPKSGRMYVYEKDIETIQGLSVNTEKDGVYGSSVFDPIKDLVFAIETRLSTENWVVDAHGKPILLVGMNFLKPDELTGGYYPSIINGKYMIAHNSTEHEMAPKYIEWDGKLDASQKIRDDLMSSFYELSEMGRCFLSGEYSGNVSSSTINEIIKSAIDKGERLVSDIWYELRKSLYVLCRLNNIDIKIEDINIEFNVNRPDDDETISKICETFVDKGILSRQTVLSRYLGYNEDQARAELDLIKKENNTGGVEIDPAGEA